MYHLVSYDKGFGIFSKCDKMPLQDFEQDRDMIWFTLKKKITSLQLLCEKVEWDPTS